MIVGELSDFELFSSLKWKKPKYVEISHHVELKWNYFWLSWCVSHAAFWLILIFEAVQSLLSVKFMFLRDLQTEKNKHICCEYNSIQDFNIIESTPNKIILFIF